MLIFCYLWAPICNATVVQPTERFCDATEIKYTYDEASKQWEYFVGHCLKGKGELSDEDPTEAISYYHRRHGIWEEYYSDGNLEARTTYKNGVRHGQFQKYYKWSENILWFEGIHNEGERVGTWTYYRRDGSTKYQSAYKEGLRIERRADGNNCGLYNLSYQYNKSTEKWDYFEGNCLMGTGLLSHSDSYGANTHRHYKRDGLWEEYYRDGTLSAKTTYKEGIRHGQFQKYRDGWFHGLIVEGHYFEGKRSGEWKFHSKYKNLIGEGEYKDGHQIGKWLSYNEAGKILTTDTYD